MPHSGEKCTQSGIYNGTCTTNGAHVKQVALSAGNTFPPCNTASCSGSVRWTLAQATK
jgi:hypothetical protein